MRNDWWMLGSSHSCQFNFDKVIIKGRLDDLEKVCWRKRLANPIGKNLKSSVKCKQKQNVCITSYVIHNKTVKYIQMFKLRNCKCNLVIYFCKLGLKWHHKRKYLYACIWLGQQQKTCFFKIKVSLHSTHAISQVCRLPLIYEQKHKPSFYNSN